LREFGCGVTSRPRRCCRNRGGLLRKQKACGKCDALQTTDNRAQGGDSGWVRVVALLLMSETDNRNESGELWNTRNKRLLGFPTCVGGEVFPLSQRQATSKVSIGILARFPLASSAGRSVHTVGLHAGRHACSGYGVAQQFESQRNGVRSEQGKGFSGPPPPTRHRTEARPVERARKGPRGPQVK